MPTYRKGEDQFELWKHAEDQFHSANSKGFTTLFSTDPDYKNKLSPKESYGAGRWNWKVSDLSGPISGDDLARGARDKEREDDRANRNSRSPSALARERMLAEDIVEHGKNKGKASEVRANLEKFNEKSH